MLPLFMIIFPYAAASAGPCGAAAPQAALLLHGTHQVVVQDGPDLQPNDGYQAARPQYLLSGDNVEDRLPRPAGFERLSVGLMLALLGNL